jgi:nucleotide-binding universal stress UspA family protein
MITQILCAIDDSAHSEKAAEFAISLTRQLSAKLTFCMINPAVLPGPLGAPVYLWTDEYVKGYLDEAFRRAMAAGLQRVRCETRRADSIAEAVVACADLCQADLIVVGSCGHRNIIDALRGTVSRMVADTAKCPVLIVKPV